MNIYQRLNEVRKAVDYIRKNKEVTGSGSYMAVTHDAVTNAVRQHLVTHGIIVSPTLIEARCADTGTTTSKGVPIIRYEGTYDIAFINSESPDDRHVMRLESHALDYGDKAPGKAISYATKYAMLKLFSIETGETDEEERIPAKGKPAGYKITPTSGAWDVIDISRQEPVRRIGADVVALIEEGRLEDAYKVLYVENKDAGKIDNDELVAIWDMLKPYSAQRRKLKSMRDEKTKSLAEQA